MKKHIIFLFSLLILSIPGYSLSLPSTLLVSNNFLVMFLVAIAVILLFVIWGLGNILLAYAGKMAEKNKSTGIKTVILFMLSMMYDQFSFAQTAMTDANTAASGNTDPTTSYFLVGVIATEFLVIFLLVFQIRQIHNALYVAPKIIKPDFSLSDKRLAWWHRLDKKFFTKAAEKDADVLLDHDYDGIKELDNALPPWWKYGFYITIVVGFMYMFHYHVSETGLNPDQEYALEISNAEKAIEEYKAKTKDLVDENNVPFETASVETGKALYVKSCVACHGASGEGGVGPNLTDEYWIHGGGMNNIFKTIKYGYPDKGMQSWQQQYSPKQIQQLSSFIHSIKGTNPPNAKPPQGDLYKEALPDTKDSIIATQAVTALMP